jgi:hypothetical protein
MKVIFEESNSSDAGTYLCIPESAYGQIVDAIYQDDKKNSVLIKGEEFVRIGCQELKNTQRGFNKGYLYSWGNFKIVEE